MMTLFAIAMTSSMLPTTQPNWDSLAVKYLPISKSEVVQEIEKHDQWIMKGKSSEMLKGKNNTQYTYSNNYEYYLALNNHKGIEQYFGITTEMGLETIPILNIYVNIDNRTNKISYDPFSNKIGYVTIEDLDNAQPDAFLWHPEGIIYNWASKGLWYEQTIKLDCGFRIDDKYKNFLNLFLDQPYIFNIIPIYGQDITQTFEYIGIVKNGKLEITDINGKKYDGINNLIIQVFGSPENFIERAKTVK